MEAEEAEADGERGDRERDRGLYQRVNQSPFRFSIVQTPLQTNFDVHRQCPRNVDLPPPPLSHPNLAPLTECLSASSWFRVPSDNQVVESPRCFQPPDFFSLGEESIQHGLLSVLIRRTTINVGSIESRRG